VFTTEQELVTISDSKKLEFPPLTFEPLGTSMTLENHLMAQEKIMIEQLTMDTFNSNLGLMMIIVDIFDSLDPAEIKCITADTIAGMVETVYTECEKLIHEQRNRMQQVSAKIVKESSN
jgi:hypothetical protein